MRPRRWPLLVLAGVVALYLGVLHPWLMGWGASADEATSALPGDAPGLRYFTRGITIHAPAADVWPWIVQIGQDRAGFYSNTWLENLAGANIHNADALHPEWQRRALGDPVRLARADLLGGSLAGLSRTEIVLLEPGRAIADIPGRFVLRPLDPGTTRLLFRESLQSQGPRLTRWLAWDPVHFVMVQRMLRGIKERAEGRPLVPRVVLVAARIGWVVSAALLLAWYLARPARHTWLAVALLPTLAPLAGASDWEAAMAGFLALGITIGGGLLLGRSWWPAGALLAAAVLLILLTAPDAFVALGLAFDLALLALAAGGYFQIRRRERPPANAKT